MTQKTLQKQPGLVKLKALFWLTAFLPVLLNGCASSSSVATNAKDAIAGEEDYRSSEHTLVKTLETPPDLFSPSYRADGFQRVLENTKADKETVYIPAYRAKHMAVKTNLSERWLEIQTADSQTVWEGINEFLRARGMKIKESRKDIGFIETDYLARKEIIPLEAMTGLTKVLNSWRPEVAEGALDRFVVQVESVPEENVVRVYFKHHQVFDGDTHVAYSSEGAGAGDWHIKPYDPRMESEALYAAMIFFGAKQGVAQEQVAASEYTIVVDDQDNTEFAGLVLSASLEAAWSYVQSMVYRADWSVDETDLVRYSMVVNVPQKVSQSQGVWESLAFWKDAADSDSQLPVKVRLDLTATEEQGVLKTILKPSALEGDRPLTADNRKTILESLGLLAR